jgi:predicted transcriptional regulator
MDKDETEAMIEERFALELQYKKDLEIAKANQIEDPTARAEALLKINADFLQREIDLVKSNSDAKQKILDDQYQIDISNTKLTEKEKDKIKAKYDLDTTKLKVDSTKKVTDLEIKSAEKVAEVKKNWYEKLSANE